MLGAQSADVIHLVRVSEDMDEDEKRGLLLLQELLQMVTLPT
jgi:hypothetical protein